MIVCGDELINTLCENDRAYYYKLINELKSDKQNKLIYITTNKLNDIVLATLRNNTIYLFNRSYNTIMYAPKLMFHMQSVTHLHIDDILDRYHNIGNGSALMTALLYYAKSNGIVIITGDLSSVDDDHKLRRNAFYLKFGFDVKKNSVIKHL